MESVQKEEIEASISGDVFSVSAAMVGVCLTVIQLIKMNGTQAANTIVDEMLAINAMIFMIACTVSFLALKNKKHSQIKKTLGNIGDGCFFIAIATMVAAITFMTFTFF